ncbi:ABC transporter substrate-binding protein [Coprococcus catus]|uniref:ABC transporter substrate-binding protein n=1 Tax=Coprococcus catus TaxID=116085 RepID=UPI001C8CF1B6|nr:ABC transporter substrate-binding protein [Coprococcus catus]MBX9229792.1 ABC transporter substrate-binding protein [Coprococcus catus]MCT6800099.1 ABC transporter substrate-binding protein [Coprococcus catus]
MKKRFLGVLLSVAMVAAVLAGCGSSGTKETAAPAGSETEAASEAASGETEAAGNTGDVITVGFSQVGAESDWRTANSESMKSTFSTENGYNLIFDDAQQKQENQIAAIRNFIQQEVDYIVLAPVTESGWDTVLQEAKDAEIPVIIVDRMVNVSDDSLYTAWVGSNFKLEGQKACEWLKAYAEAKGMSEVNIVDIQGTIGASAQIGRTEALNEAVKANGWNLLAQQTGEFTQAKGQEVMESMLKQYDNINVVYCENDNEAFGAIEAIKAAGKTVGPDGDILVMSFDTTKQGITDTLSGDIIVNTECNPLHGPRVEQIIKQLQAGETPEKQAYVEEGIYAHGSDVASVSIDGTDYEVTEVTQDVVDARAY